MSSLPSNRTNRRYGAFPGAVAALALCLAGIVPATAQVPALPKSPVTINIVDVAGDLALTQDAIELYAKKNPNLVSKFNFTKAPSPELAGQAQGDAGGGPQRHRSRADGHRLPRRRDRAGAARQAAARVRVEVPEPDGELPASRREDAGAGTEPGHRSRVHAGGPAARVQPGQGEAGADDAGGAARVVQGQSQSPHLRAAGELRAGAHVHHGAAVHSRRQGPEGSGQGLGQDVGVSQGAQLVHRVLPDGHRRP